MRQDDGDELFLFSYKKSGTQIIYLQLSRKYMSKVDFKVKLYRFIIILLMTNNKQEVKMKSDHL